ncbi:MAG: tetratricopeptide repeat protein [Hahellaceae bacterium]|nr:tetratricopeptide repeat protein [Hahellaceae bacterium]
MLNARVRVGSILIFAVLLLTGCVTETTSSFNNKASASKAADSYVELALAYLRNREYDLALNRLEKALEISPQHLEANAILGLVYQEQGEASHAEAQYRKAIDIDPSFTRGRTYLAAFLFNQGRLDESLEESRKAAEDLKFNGRYQIFSNIGMIESQLGRQTQAIEAYEKSLLLRRDQPNCQLALSGLYLATGNLTKAARNYGLFWEAVRSGDTRHTPASLETGIQIARAAGDKDKEASLWLYLKNEFPNSAEYQRLSKGQ